MSQCQGFAALLNLCLLVVLAFCGLVALAAPAPAQVAYGSVVGVVKDEQGGVLPGASVELTNSGTNLERETVTDPQGAYNFVNVLPGTYVVKVSMPSFRESVRTGVPVSVGQISRVDVILELGTMTDTVIVQSQAELLQTDKADVKTELTPETMTNLPLNSYRNVQSLVVLVPGSLPPTFQNLETDTPQRSLNMNVNGLGGAANTTLTDGTRSVNVAMPYHEQYIQPVETIETVSITTGSMDAETGMAAGAAIAVTTKSGTNIFRGSAFEYFNNEKLNADPYYFGTGAVPVKLPVQRQTAGGTLGGPIVRNLLFFFGSYEGYFSRASRYVFYSVPDAALRNGDFSGALNTNGTVQQIYDPFSGDLTTGMGRVQFPGNVIPAGMINPISKLLQQMYPAPNVEGTGAGNLTNNYRTEQVSTSNRHNIDFKVNWNRSSAHQIWSKFSEMHAVVNDIFTFPLSITNAKGVGGGPTVVKQLTAGQTWSLRPTLLLDSAFGYMDSNQEIESIDNRQGNMGLDLGIRGTNDQGLNDTRYAGLPTFSTGFTAIGNTPTFWPVYMYQNHTTLSTNLTKIAGRHDLKGGYLLSYLQNQNWQAGGLGNSPRGQLTFASNATRTFGTGVQTANFYNQYAAFLLGLVSTAGKSNQPDPFTTREFQHALYFRDRWTPNSRTTLDLGLRWEYYPLMVRANGGIEMLDLKTLNVLIGGQGGNPMKLGLSPSKNAFAPRLGIVFRLDEKTVLRSGYGVTYDARGMGAEEAFEGFGIYPLGINATFQTPAAQSTFGWRGTIDQGIPFVAGPDVSSGRVPLPNDVGMKTVIPQSMQRGKVHSWNVAFERRLPGVSIDVAYVGNKQVGGLTTINVNPVLTLGAGATNRPYLITNGRQLAVSVYMPYQKTEYNALQIGVSRPLTRGLLLQGHYTYGSSWALTTNYTLPSAEAQSYDFARLGIPENAVDILSPGPDALVRNWSPTSGSRRHVLTMSMVYQLPWQSGMGGGNALTALYRDWQLNGVLQAFSGAPFSVTADGTSLNTPGNTQTADLVGPIVKIGKIGADGLYYDPAAWGQPTCVCFGNTTVNQFTGPGGWNLDFSIFRAIPLKNTQRLEIRIEATNVTNTPKFANPTNSLTSGNFMRVLSLNNAFAERNVRLALRFSF